MVYPTQHAAQRAADALNERRGFGRARAVLTPDGWTVIVNVAWGLSGPAGFDVAE